MREWRYGSTILDLETIWRLVVSFIPRPLCIRYPFDRKLGGRQSRSGRYVEERNLALSGNRTPAIQPVAIPALLSKSITKYYLITLD
jgi:hypothetical protein